jgi:hypothetical protein
MPKTAYKSLKLIRPVKDRNKENSFTKRNLQLMRKREIDALVERTRQDIIDKYIDLEF